ncbi:MAG: ATP-binding cassette domain-containing protein [Stenotrophomonas sp.]|uniref:phosphatase domain-containing putative toxin n=1 Tax=Stenotrophomonas sp. TaxID=69392 RepID=UPI003D6DA08B
MPFSSAPTLLTDSPLLKIENWGMSRGRRTILTAIDFTLAGPGIVVLMGPGGTGKSSLLHALSGQHNAHGERWGHIFFQGQPLHAAAQPPVLVHQQPRELGFSVLENLSAALRQRQSSSQQELREEISTRLQALGAAALLAHLQQRVIDLPRGLARQLAIVRAAFSGSPLLLIDEPTSELEPADADAVLGLIERLGKTHACLVTLHHQAQARRIASRALLLAGGYVQVDAPADAFFANDLQHPVLAQFLRTGSCHVPAPDARAEELAEHVAAPAPIAPVPTPRPAPAVAITPQRRPASQVALPATPSRRGPNGFHWLQPGKLAGCPMPGVVFAADHDLALLRGMGVTVLVNLTETATSAELLARHGMRSYHLGIPDRGAPPLLWAKLLLAKIEVMLRDGDVVAVHCLAGLGRTGMVLAAWLIREGLNADEALRRLRTIEPGFVQSQEQEALLHALEENLLIRAG